MARLSLSEKYAAGAAVLLLLVAFLNNAIATLVIGVLGFVAGLLVARTSKSGRAAMVGLVGFAVAAALGAVTLLQR